MSIARADFDYLRGFLLEKSAIILDDDKEYLASIRLAPLVQNEGFASVEDLLGNLRRRRPDSDLPCKVLDAMTNNETWFFRDYGPFEALRQQALPELLAARSGINGLRLWSAACSTGQEPYSLALLLREHFSLANWTVQILATDISTQALDRARRGRYSQLEINRGLPVALLPRYFRRANLDFELVSDIRNLVEFKQFNLSQPWPELPKMDVIFLRNVMIYFDVEIRRQILARVRSVLQPDGVLFLGCAETTLNLDSNFERVTFEKTAYYKVRP
jgi:chemotaxis protein methyltransferase CheR